MAPIIYCISVSFLSPAYTYYYGLTEAVVKLSQFIFSLTKHKLLYLCTLATSHARDALMIGGFLNPDFNCPNPMFCYSCLTCTHQMDEMLIFISVLH